MLPCRWVPRLWGCILTWVHWGLLWVLAQHIAPRMLLWTGMGLRRRRARTRARCIVFLVSIPANGGGVCRNLGEVPDQRSAFMMCWHHFKLHHRIRNHVSMSMMVCYSNSVTWVPCLLREGTANLTTFFFEEWTLTSRSADYLTDRASSATIGKELDCSPRNTCWSVNHMTEWSEKFCWRAILFGNSVF